MRILATASGVGIALAGASSLRPHAQWPQQQPSSSAACDDGGARAGSAKPKTVGSFASSGIIFTDTLEVIALPDPKGTSALSFDRAVSSKSFENTFRFAS